MRKQFKACLLIAIILGSMPLAGCDKKTTLNRIGAIAVAAVTVYESHLKDLRRDSVIDQAKYESLALRAAALRRHAELFRDDLAKLAAVAPGDVPNLLRQIGALLAEFRDALADPVLTSSHPKITRAVKPLSYAVAVLTNASDIVAVLFPANADGAQPRRTAAVVVPLPQS